MLIKTEVKKNDEMMNWKTLREQQEKKNTV